MMNSSVALLDMNRKKIACLVILCLNMFAADVNFPPAHRMNPGVPSRGINYIY